MALSRAQQVKQLIPGLNALFGMEYNRYENEHAEIYTTESSDRSFEEEVKLSGFGPAPVKTEGAGVVYDSAQEAWTARYDHETVAMAFALTEEAVEDNLYEAIGARYTKALARAMAHTKQVKAAYPLNAGFSAYETGDGVSLMNAAHPLVSGGSNSNVLTTPSDLNETALENATIQIGGWTDERGLIIAAKPRKLIIPRQYQFVAKRILDSELRVGTADNDLNAMRALGTLPEGYRVNHFLTDPDAWFLMTDVPNGAKHFQRVAMSTGMDGDFDTGNARYKARERYSFGFSDPLAIFGTPGAG